MTTLRHAELVDNLRKEFEIIRPDRSKSSDWWGEKQEQLHELVAGDSDPNTFFLWSPIDSTMYCGEIGYASNEIGHLRSLPDWETRWRPAIIERGEFNMPRFPSHLESTSTTIHHAYHLSMFEGKTGIRIDDMGFIFEFGGGYGDTCRIIHRLGFKGNYVICDLPELLALQRFFLEASGIRVALGAVELVDSIAAVRPPIAGKRCAISTWAIEESIPSLNDAFASLMPQFDHFLFALGGDGCFSRIKRELTDVEWHQWEIPFLKGHQYMMGKRHAH